jgi:hypothetical protein
MTFLRFQEMHIKGKGVFPLTIFLCDTCHRMQLELGKAPIEHHGQSSKLLPRNSPLSSILSFGIPGQRPRS